MGRPLVRASGDEHVGRTFGNKYRIDKLIAKGGMGRVYRATQFPLERPVAIKILNREFQQSDPQFVKRFFLEASIAAQLSHPHTITVFDYGESESGDLYIAMELLEGRSLSRILRADGPFSAEETLRLSTQICRALRAAHEKGIIHRDLKPGNIFVLDEQTEDGGGWIKVLDFGLVKLFTPESSKGNALGPSMLGEDQGELTRTGTLLGSPKYMSPEQIQGLPLDPRTDVYSFGIIMYQMLSGKAPFTGTTGVDVIYKHVNFPVPPISTQNPDVEHPPEIEEIVRKCLEKRREDRFASMDALLEGLKEAQKLITGASFAGEVMSSDVSSRDRRRALTVAARAREASLREPIGDEATPLGATAPEQTGQFQPPNTRASRAPLALAGVGFLVALATLVYVLGSGPIQPAQPSAAQQARPQPIAPAIAPAPVAPIVAPANVTEPAPAILEQEEPEEPKKKSSKKRKRKTRGHSQKPDERDELSLPPNYRENPY